MEDKNKYQIESQTECSESGKTHRFSINYYVYETDCMYIAYCPALDLTTTGTDFNDAVSQFYEAFQLYVECCIEEGTLMTDLKAHGWKIKGVKITPPTFKEQLERPGLKKLMESGCEFEGLKANYKIPAAAL